MNQNALNTIRLLAAFNVIYGHTVAHLDLSMPMWLGKFVSLFCGVPIFFAMSGFLIWHSIGNSKNFRQYLQKRFWRIYPELWVAVIAEILVLLILFKDKIDWFKLGVFAFTQGSVFQFWTPDFLRSYGCGCPNGSLWTICVLIQLYFTAYYIHKCLHGLGGAKWIPIMCILILISALTDNICNMLPEIIAKLYTVSLIPYLWLFVVGAFIAEFKDVILPFLRRNWYYILCINLAISYQSLFEDIALCQYNLLQSTTVILGLLGLAFRIPQLNIKTDISYALYLYHMTVVNAFIEIGLMNDVYLLFVVILVTSAISYISTVTIGRLSQKKKVMITQVT